MVGSGPADDDRARLPGTLAAATTIQILSTATALALTAIAPEVGPQLGVEAHYVGYQISLIYAAGMVSSAAAGTLVARFGPVRIEQAALATFAAGLLGLASGRLWIMALASLVIGMGYGLQNPASSQLLSAVTPPHRRSLVFSIKQAGVPAGAVLASLLFPLLAPVTGWRAALALAALAPALMIPLMAYNHAGERYRPPARTRGVTAAFLAEQRLVLGSPQLRDLALLGLLYSSVQLSVSAFTVTLLVGQGWTVVAAGAAAGLVNGCGAVGRVVWGGLADRLRAGFAVLAGLGFASTVLLLLLDDLPALPVPAQLLLLGTLGFCISGWSGVQIAELSHRCAPQDVGRVVGGGLVYTFLGVGIGPAGFAMLFDQLDSYGRTFQIFGAITLAGSLLATRRARRA